MQNRFFDKHKPLLGVAAVAAGIGLLVGVMYLWQPDNSTTTASTEHAQDFAALRTGQRARITVQGMPGKTFQGRVDFIYPTIDPQTRTVKVRVVLPNPNLQLRPDMCANVTIQAGGSASQVLAPKSALLRSGRDDVVILALGEGRFRPQKIRIGGESGENYAVLWGLKEGETVVTSAQFLLDSESRIHEAIQKLNTGDGAPATESENTEIKPAPAPTSKNVPPATPKAGAPTRDENGRRSGGLRELAIQAGPAPRVPFLPRNLCLLGDAAQIMRG